MKVLKKIKARIGLSNKAALHCPPAQPLEFHPVHGDNVLLTQGNTIAARYSFFTASSPCPITTTCCIEQQETRRPLSSVVSEQAGTAELVRLCLAASTDYRNLPATPHKSHPSFPSQSLYKLLLTLSSLMSSFNAIPFSFHKYSFM